MANPDLASDDGLEAVRFANPRQSKLEAVDRRSALHGELDRSQPIIRPDRTPKAPQEHRARVWQPSRIDFPTELDHGFGRTRDKSIEKRTRGLSVRHPRR